MDNKRLIELLTLLQEGKMENFDEFYEATKRGVYSASYTIVQDHTIAEDVLQETYLRFLEKLPSLHKDRSILAYLMKTAQNLSLNIVKERNRFDDGVDITKMKTEDPPPQDDYIFSIMKRTLKPKETQIVILHVIEDMTHEQIAEALHKPLGTVLWTYHNAIEKLRKEMDKDENRRKTETRV